MAPGRSQHRQGKFQSTFGRDAGVRTVAAGPAIPVFTLIEILPGFIVLT